jgi:hypothetical protein
VVSRYREASAKLSNDGGIGLLGRAARTTLPENLSAMSTFGPRKTNDDAQEMVSAG